MTDTTTAEPTPAEERTLERALAEFTLAKGSVGSESSRQACAMSLASWVAGEEFSDHPPCTHRWLSDIVIRAFDDEATTDEQGIELTKAAVASALDTWWIPAPVLVLAVAMAPGPEAGQLAHALGVLALVDQWKAEGHPVNSLNRASLNRASLIGRPSEFK